MKRFKLNCYINKNFKFEWIISIAIAILMLLSFVYIDLKSLTIWTTNLWDVIAQGDITQYFAYTAQNIYNAPHQYVSGTLYSLIPWAVWNLPIWVIQHFFNKPILKNSILLLWSQLFLVICLIGVLILVRKIMMKTTNDKAKSNLAMFLTFSSIWVYVGVFYAGQNDIMICLLGIASIYALMKKNTKMFLILGSFAISVKYFFIFPFLALVLLTEKNTYKIIGKILIGLTPTVIFNLICRGLPMFIESSKSGPTDRMFKELFGGGISGFTGVSMSLFVVALVIVLFISYITKCKDDEYDKFIIYTTALGFVPVLMFTTIQFYRLILIIPFIVMIILQNKKILKLNLILENILEVSALIILLLKSKYLFGIKYVNIGLIPKFLKLKPKNLISVGQKITEIMPDISKLTPLFSALVVVSMIILIVINHPRFNDKYIEFKEEKYERWLLWIRPLATLTCVGAMYYLMK